jgi:hypothetical protein
VVTVSFTQGTGPPAPHIRLLLVVDALEVGGAERHVVDLAVMLAREGYEVMVACSVAGGLSEALGEANVPVRPLLDKLVKRRVSGGPAGGSTGAQSTSSPYRARSASA